MDENTRQANVVLTADTTNYSSQMASATTQTNNATTAVSKLIDTLDRLQRTTSRRLEIISATTMAGIGAATIAAAKFESQLSTLQATAAITGKNFTNVSRSVDDLRRNLPVSTEQVVALVNALQKMGASQANVKSLAETFVKLGAATGDDIGTLATNLVSLQRAMGTSEATTRKFADTTAHLSASLGVSASGLLQFANQLAPVARTVGITQTQVMGFSAAFLKAGQDGYAASTVFTKLLTDISRATRYGSNDIYAYANAVGMTAEQFKNLPAASQATAFFNAVNRQGADAIKTLERLGYDGPRALKAIQGLAQSGGLSGALTEAGAGFNSGATEKGAKAAMDGLNDSLQKLQNNLTSIAQAFGSTFLPVITKAVDGITGLTSALRTVLAPFNSLMGMLGAGGGALTGIAGFALSNFSTLATVAAGYALLRNPLTAGIASVTRGANTRSPILRNAMSTYADGGGSRAGQFFYGMGQRVGGATGIRPGDPFLGSPRQGTGLLGRAAMFGSGMFQTGMGLLRAGVDPLRWSAATDMAQRGRYPFIQGRDAYRSAMSGQNATVGRAFAGATAAILQFGRATISATGGVTRLGAMAAASAARQAVGAVGGMGRGLMGLAGGPIGLAVMGGFAGASMIGEWSQQSKDFRDKLQGSKGDESAVNKVASSLGLASAAALSFADTVNKAANNIVVTDASRARAVTATDRLLAETPGRALTDSSIKGMSVGRASAYTSSVFAGSGVDPQIMQSMKLDLIQQFGVDKANQIINRASSGNIDMAALTSGQGSGASGTMSGFASLFRPGNNLKGALGQTESTYSTLGSQVYNQYGAKESNKLTAATVNSLLELMGSPDASGTGDMRAIGQTIAKVIGEDDLKLTSAQLQTLSMAGEGPINGQTQQQLFQKYLTQNGVGSNYTKMFGGLSAGAQAATTYRMPAPGTVQDQYSRLGVYETTAGGQVAGTGIGQTIRQALASPDDANKQLSASTQWAQSLTNMTGSTSGANAEFQRLKAAIKDTTDPLYQMAAAAQAAVGRLQGYQGAYQSGGMNARQTLGNLAVAYAAKGPDAQQQVIAAEDQYEAARSGLYDQFRNIVKTYREFDIQQSRAMSDYTRQRKRSDQDYNLQRQYAESDYWLQKNRAQENYDRSRRRSEEDYQHQVEVQIRQTAKTITNAYQMITTQPTWDAQNLLTNSNDQLARMQQQQGDLATVRNMGLSGDVISQLGLNDFANQQQLARMVQDLANDPSLVTKWNEAIQGKLDISKAFVTDQDSESWKEMERQYKLSLDRMAEDFSIMNMQGEADYRKTLDRQNLAYATSMARTGEDFRRQMGQAREDLNRSFQEITGSFTEMSDAALSQLTGVTKAQYQELNTALGQSREQIKGSLATTSDDIIKLLAPLFGGEDAARAALSSAATNKTFTSPSMEWNMSQARGGGDGSEHPSGGGSGGIGGPGMNFPLPAGSWTKTSGYGMRKNPVTGQHRLHAGVDLAARSGTPIGAAEDGVVTKAQVMGGLGNMVEVSHGDGTRSWYGHMSMITARPGQPVSAGQQIGLVGSTGNSTGPHLHFEKHVNGKAVDPWGYLQGLGTGAISGAGMMGMAPDISGMQSVQQVEKGFQSLPMGQAYKPGLFTSALQSRINGFAGMPMQGVGGSDSPGVSSGSLRRGGYAQGSVVMETRSVTYQQHFDQGTEYSGQIVVHAQDPNEMERKLAEKQRLKALVRPARGTR